MIADEVAFALTELRAHAESRMTATATIRRKGDSVVVDGLKRPTWPLVADVPCWVDRPGPTRTATIGSIETQVATRTLKVPHDTLGLRDGDIAEIVGGACDGRFFRIVEATIADQKKQQELPVVEIQKPEGWS